MVHWEPRILSEVVGDGTEYFVSEVCYGKDGNVRSWTDRDALDELFVQQDLDDLRGVISRLHDALTKPVLHVAADGLLGEVR